MKAGFDNQLYVEKQTSNILQRIDRFSKLYLEFGGKLFDDYHAARVLPGFDVNAKVRILQQLKDQAEIIFCISAGDIESNKIRADFGITYDMDVLRLIDNLRGMGLYINSVLITQYAEQPAADLFRMKLERRGVKTYVHKFLKGYPAQIDVIVSDDGYGMNPFIETTRPLVVVTAPGPGSGKLATCLSQLYHEYKRGVKAGYAKFETFPIWNLPLKHPVNLAYEAATADLNDVNMIDPFHLEAYGSTAVNYNRDIDAFPIVKAILSRITGNDSYYRSPTDMGVNMAGYGIFDDEVVRQAACQEIIRRYYKAKCDYKQGRTNDETVQKILMIMKQLTLTPEDRRPVAPALAKARQAKGHAMCIVLKDGRVITGRTSELMAAPASCVINAIKVLAGIPDEMKLISPIILAPILKLKKDVLTDRDSVLDLEEALIALSICEATNPMVEVAMERPGELQGCEAHSTCMLPQSDEGVLRHLKLNLTCEPEFPSDDLYYG